MQESTSMRPALRAVLVAEAAIVNANSLGRMNHWVFGLQVYNSKVFKQAYSEGSPNPHLNIQPPNFPEHPKDRHARYLPGALSKALKRDIDRIDSLFATQESITQYAEESPALFPLVFATYLTSKHVLVRRWEFLRWVATFIEKQELVLMTRLFMRVRVSKMLDHSVVSTLSLPHFPEEHPLHQTLQETHTHTAFRTNLSPQLLNHTTKETLAHWLVYEAIWRLSLGLKFEEQAAQFGQMSANYYSSSSEVVRQSALVAFCNYSAFLALSDEYFTLPVDAYYNRLLYRPTFEACLDAAQVF